MAALRAAAQVLPLELLGSSCPLDQTTHAGISAAYQPHSEHGDHLSSLSLARETLS